MTMDAVGDRSLGTLPETRAALDFAPELHPALFESVQRRRTIAFLIDMTIVTLLVLIGGFAITMFGIMTLGLGWLLFPALAPVVVLGYAAFGASRYSATPGMRMVGLAMRNWTGTAVDGLIGALHSLLYWVSTAVLTPFVLLFGLFNPRKRLLHDIVAGVVVMDAGALRRVEV
ncbi:MAG: RDD family protein [Pseudomonadota bacterium]